MKKGLFSLIVCIFTILLLASCSNNDSVNKKDGASSNSDGANSDNVTVAFQENVQTLDPHAGSSGIDISVQNSMYESLFTPDEEGELQPLLAKSYELSDDGLTYTFQLRKDVTFTDGAPFDANAVKANIDRILESDGALNAYKGLRGVKKVTVDGDDVVNVTLKDTNSQFIHKIGVLRLASPKAIKDDNFEFGKESAGTGPFILKKWNHGDSLVVVKNDDYWKDGYPKVDQVTFKPIPEDGSRVAMLKTGDVDIMYPVPVNDVKELKKMDGIKVDVQPSTYVNYVTLNTSKKPFDNEKVRKAMNYAIDKDAYIKVVKKGFEEKPYSPLPSTNVNYTKQEPYKFNLKKAKELMKEAGYEDGFSTDIWGSDSSKDKLGMQFVKQQLKQIGIDVDIKQMERGTLGDKINKPKTPEESEVQMWYVGWSSTPGDTDNAINPLFSSTSFPPNGSNTAYYKNDKVDKLIEDALHAKTADESQAKYDEIQEIIYDEAPWLFMGTDQELLAMKDNIKDAWRSADGNMYINNMEIK